MSDSKQARDERNKAAMSGPAVSLSNPSKGSNPWEVKPLSRKNLIAARNKLRNFKKFGANSETVKFYENVDVRSIDIYTGLIKGENP